MNALVLDQVCKSRGSGAQRVAALRDVSLRIRRGELVMLEGPSGSGKTTLLAVAGSLLTADSGSVELGGESLCGRSSSERRRLRASCVGFVFQHANLLTSLSVRQNLLLRSQLAGVGRAEAARSADELLERLGIEKLADRFPAALSGGEEMRAAVARALVHRPILVLADEPSASLDGDSALSVADALSRIARERNAAVLVATHDARLTPYSDRRAGLLDGRLRNGGGNV
jgi:putative ABC transport system ATP-binding protein